MAFFFFNFYEFIEILPLGNRKVVFALKIADIRVQQFVYISSLESHNYSSPLC